MKTKSIFCGKTVFLMLIFSVLILGQLAVAAEFKLKIKISDAEIRLRPNNESTLVSKVPLGAILKSKEKIGEWYKVDLPPDAQGIVVTGYIHQSAVEVTEEMSEEVISREDTEERMNEQTQDVQAEKKKKFSLRTGLGLAFPSGDWSDLFNLGLGVMVGNSFSLIRQEMFDVDLIGSFEGYMFFRETGYTDISWARILLAGDLRLSLKIDQFSLFGQGGFGIYLDIIEVSDWWWGRTSASEFRFGPRIGGGIAFGKMEVLGLYHLVEDKMFTIMIVWNFRF